MTTPQPRRLSVGTLAPPDVILEIGGVDYEIRGDLPVDEMIALLGVHQRLDAVVSPTVPVGETPEQRAARLEAETTEALRALGEANRMIRGMIRERYPDATVPSLGLDQVLGILKFITQNEGGPIAEVEETLVAGVPPPTEDEVNARVAEILDRERRRLAGEDVDDPPTTPSTSDFSTPSSPLASASTSGPSGGGDAHGADSEPTART